MHTDNDRQARAGVDPAAFDDQVAEGYDRSGATEERRPASPPARPLSEALGYPPLCAHVMSSFADGRYDLALARLRRG